MRRKRCGRLVHDQHAHIERQCPGDFDGLLLGKRETACRALDIDLDAEARQQRAGVFIGLLPVHHSPAIAMADENVLRDIEVGKHHRLLIDRGDPKRLRCAGTVDGARLAIDEYLARAWLMHAGHDLYQRRFAGAVFADERMDLARPQHHRNAVERFRHGEILGNATHFQNRLGHCIKFHGTWLEEAPFTVPASPAASRSRRNRWPAYFAAASTLSLL